MTRDEAVKKLIEKTVDVLQPADMDKFTALCAAEVETWVALGMLKLDEPKNKDLVFVFANEFYGPGMGERAIDDIRLALEAVGLKIVEK